jgi:hypothetical protein
MTALKRRAVMLRVLKGGRLIDGTGAGPVEATIVIKNRHM